MKTSYGDYGVIRYEGHEGRIHEVGIYFHRDAAWKKTVANAERVARMLFGADTVKKVVWVCGNAA